MEEAKLVSVLEDAGLSPYQANAYVALLELGAASATEIADASEVPDPRIYDVLRDLESKGFVETYTQESLRARALDPSRVMTDLQSRANQFERAAAEIDERWTQPAIEQSTVSVVSRLETVVDDAAEAIRSARNQVQLCVPVELFDELESALATAVENGARVKLTVTADDRAAVEALDLDRVSTETRYRELVAPFVAVTDRTKAYFVPHRDSTNQYGVIVDDRTLAYVFHWFFLSTLWDVWDVVYREDDDGLPTVYVNVRYCIRDIRSFLEDGKTVSVSIDGTNTMTGERRTIEGTVVDVATSNQLDSIADGGQGTLSVADFAGIASLDVDTGDGVVSIGGWGATIEQFEAERITITGVRERADER